MFTIANNFGKPPVSALQEYCAKKGYTLPQYEFIDAEDGTKSFVCSVEALDQTVYGKGRSKKDAKHDAAANLIRFVAQTHADIMEIPQAPHEAIPTTDAVMALRDYCVQQNHPLPVFDLVQQAGPPEAPEFTFACQLASLKRYGIANSKKAAKQKAALEILSIVQMASSHNQIANEIATIDSKIEDDDEERYRKIKTYRELTESGGEQKPGQLLSDRHFFFEKFHDPLKREAKRILNDETTYDSNQVRVNDLFRALKINPNVKSIETNTVKEHIFIDLRLEYDVLFAGPKDKIYSDIIIYFQHMI